MGTLVYLVCIAVASFTVLAQPAVAQGASAQPSLTFHGRVLQGVDNQTCPSEEQREIARNRVKTATGRLLRESFIPDLQVFLCDGSPGWRRVAYLNMSDPSQQCPSVWQEITTPHRVCGRRSTSASCEGLTYSTGSVQYDQVCGRIISYQKGTVDAFLLGPHVSIDSYYVDGVSVTHGSPRQHVWTFAAGIDERTVHADATCPCVAGSLQGSRIPSFVGQNYFCETGVLNWGSTPGVFYPNGDPLWDGLGCGPASSCCTFNSPPWFSVVLPSPTTDDIEVRICDRADFRNEDSPIQLIELYVK